MLRRLFGRIGFRLLVVNSIVLLVPLAGLEFARLYEKQLLGALERDMRNQILVARALLPSGLFQADAQASVSIHDALRSAAARTATRIRVVDPSGAVIADSHRRDVPEGPEAPVPTVMPDWASVDSVEGYSREGARRAVLGRPRPDDAWPPVAERREIIDALAGKPSSHTRLRPAPAAVFLFVSEPVLEASGAVIGAIYATRSTHPVLVELYRIRRGLIEVLLYAMLFSSTVTVLLALTISRPLRKLSRAARRIASGERDVSLPVTGSGEIRELSESFGTMTQRLEERRRFIEGFAADVAHELKSPLTSIRGAAELLAEGAADDLEARARFLRNITLDVERLDVLVTRLLELSRIDASSAPMAFFDLEALCRQVVERCDDPDRPVLFELRAPTRLYAGRAHDLETALINLVDNAQRFSPEGEAVKVILDGDTRGHFAVRVVDKGPGISDAHRARIFDRFFTTDAERGGTGLGLAIVKSVAEAHGGSIAVEGASGGGTVFTLTLPYRPLHQA